MLVAKTLIYENAIVFDAKPDAVPYNYRISYKVSQLCLIICKSSIKGCSLLKLHMISYALISRDGMDKLVDFAAHDGLSVPIVRFDPAVNKALNYAIADNLIEQQQNGNYKLTKKGKEIAHAIDSDVFLMFAEKRALSTLSKTLTEAKIDALSDTWRNTYAES